MAQRTITISESAAKALDDLKREGESISDVILKLTKKADLLEYVKSAEFSEELVDKIEEVYNDRREYTLKSVSGDKEGYIKALKKSAGILKMNKKEIQELQGLIGESMRV